MRSAVVEDLGLGIGKANLDIFAQTLLQLACADRNIVVLTSDSRGSGKLRPFGQRLPEQIVEVGVAEQNLVAVAAGLAAAGKKVFAVSPACFLTARALEQIKNDVCYSDWPVRLIGISAGVSYGPLGSTHHSLHDIAALRAIHNCTIIVPADNIETEQLIRASLPMTHPVYIRFGREPVPNVHRPGTKISMGKAVTVKDGTDLAFIATGQTVACALKAAILLEEKGICAKVISMHTIKPLDTDTLIDTAKRCKAIITVEEHSCAGGLGEACAGFLMQAGIKTLFRIVGLPDEHTVTGTQMEIFEHYGISGVGLAHTAIELLKRDN